MGKIVINTVYNVYMYGHGQIHVTNREATCIHHFYSIFVLLMLLGVCPYGFEMDMSERVHFKVIYFYIL